MNLFIERMVDRKVSTRLLVGCSSASACPCATPSAWSMMKSSPSPAGLEGRSAISLYLRMQATDVVDAQQHQAWLLVLERNTDCPCLALGCLLCVTCTSVGLHAATPCLPARQLWILHKNLPHVWIPLEHATHVADGPQAVGDGEALQEAITQAPGIQPNTNIATAAKCQCRSMSSGQRTWHRLR